MPHVKNTSAQTEIIVAVGQPHVKNRNVQTEIIESLLLARRLFCIQGIMMEIRKLDYSFYSNNSHLKQTLSKERGYGIVVISLEGGLKFGIPLRSNLPNKACFVTKTEIVDGEEQKKGLDYSKALLIADDAYVSAAVFMIPVDEKDAISKKSQEIAEEFEKYVAKYIHAVKNSHAYTLGSREYRFTTLQNYHSELGI